MTDVRRALRSIACTACLGVMAVGGARAQTAQPFGTVGAMPDLRHGALLFHGNYCGPGNRGPGMPPTDALDRACMRHDSCSPDVGSGLPTCGCNRRLRHDALLVARDRRQPDDLRVLAQSVADGSVLLPCR